MLICNLGFADAEEEEMIGKANIFTPKRWPLTRKIGFPTGIFFTKFSIKPKVLVKKIKTGLINK